MNNRSMRLLTLIWAGLMIAILSSSATLLLAGRGAASDKHWVTQQEYERIQKYDRLDEVCNTLVNDYYKELDESDLLLGAIRGMTGATGDPYTFYYTPEELNQSNENDSGLYHGIGVLVQRTDEGFIQILRVYPDTPAEAAGLTVGDLVVAVEGNPISGEDGRTYNDAIAQIRGPAGTSVKITVQRGDDTWDMEVGRADVNISYAEYSILDGNIGYLSISQFTGDAKTRTDEAFEAFKAQNVRGVVVDLRNNPGGLLDQVVAITDSLLPSGVIVYTQDRDGTRRDYFSDENMYDVPMTVLVNNSSASASEIFAASMQVFGRATVLGETTYGKGIVQTQLTFEEDGAGLQLTTSSYYDGNGRSIHGVGVVPDIEVALEQDRIPLDPDPENDSQLRAALEELERLIELPGDVDEAA